ncbi:ankyrin and HET domain-containing protein [Colletotrichum kahawae]|uniref:Ankyrin and HET domain-containing protein n=1 Tax=Colletotrichum kahawae TaxID=34407 RepID=A0AAD9YJR9_COLKA|nr:ankyrin and HET domain-containing protein [Colletotrichum kahawae]
MGWSFKKAVAGIRHSGPKTVEQPDGNLYDSLRIGPNGIRLLKIQPATSLNSPVIATLVTAKRSDSMTKYDALSYMWGNHNERGTIYVNGQPMDVTRSLHTALRYLRLPREEVVIWADAICINQTDTQEKSVQVGKMNEIYTQARSVRIWLGEAGPDTDLGMSVINSCSVKMSDGEIIGNLFRNQKSGMGLVDILSRPYWFRTWMFQEIVLARRAFVHCGTSVADWSMFIRADFVIAHISRTGRLRYEWAANLLNAFSNITRFTIPPSNLKDIDTVLMSTRGLQATESRDKLYGLMGVCDLAKYITVDYSKSARDVYVEFTRNFSQRTGDLRLLCTAGPWDDRNGKDMGLPSWVPDFRGNEGVEPGFVAAAHDKTFDACKGHRFGQAGQDGYDDGVLTVEGFVIDTIETTMPWSVGDAGRKQLFERLGIANNRGEMLGAIPLDQRNVPNVSTWLGYDPEIDFKLLTEEYMNLRKSKPGALDEYRARFVGEVNASRGIEVTGFKSVGNYIGRTTHAGKVGDVVAVLHGSQFPVVLRQLGSRKGPRYQYIGPCYAKGLMFGEAIDAAEAQGMKVSRLALV